MEGAEWFKQIAGQVNNMISAFQLHTTEKKASAGAGQQTLREVRV